MTRSVNTEERGGIRGPVEREIVATLSSFFPEANHLDVINESAGHAVPRGSETHFRIVVVSPRFAGLTRLARHRLVQQAIAELAARVKAIALRPLTPDEWQQGEGQEGSPTCAGLGQ